MKGYALMSVRSRTDGATNATIVTFIAFNGARLDVPPPLPAEAVATSVTSCLSAVLIPTPTTYFVIASSEDCSDCNDFFGSCPRKMLWVNDCSCCPPSTVARSGASVLPCAA